MPTYQHLHCAASHPPGAVGRRAPTAHVREASDALYAAVKAYQKHSASAFKHRAAAHGLLPVVELHRIKLRKALAALDVAQAAISVAEAAR